MSGIYIPWMSMPRTCDDCQVSADCPNDEHIDGYNMQNRPRFCQIVPVPDHKGPLVDSLEVINTFPEGFIFTNEQARALTNYIIPAEPIKEEAE